MTKVGTIITIGIIAIFIIAFGLVIFLSYIEKRTSNSLEEQLEAQIIQLANEDADIQGEEPVLELISIDKVGWAKYKCYNYIMTTTTHRYHIGVMRNESEIHFVDVVSESTRGTNET